MDQEIILQCEHISKAFGGTKALSDVQLQVAKGEVHALLGENGAGKSTLMRTVIGLYKPDAGTIAFEGKPYVAHGPAQAIEQGISMIHQELNSEPYLSVAENIFLHREDTYGKTFLLHKRETNRKAKELLEKFGVKINPKTLVGDLTLAQAQIIEIIKAVSCNARLIIMDEPTSSLDSQETENLFATIRGLKAQGVSIIYISHRMDEIYEICDHVTVFRDGKYINSMPVQSVTRNDLISMMVGRDIANIYPKVDHPIGKPVFRVEGFTGKGFVDISFEVNAGEILGISGLVGSGRSETMRAIFGLDKHQEGKLYLDGRELTIRNPREAIAKGICMINEDRKRYGLCLFRSIRENVSITTLRMRQKKLLINQRREKRETKDITTKLDVKASSIETDVFSLSGGNQQKVVLSKWIAPSPRVMIMDEPTRGVDVGAKSEIYSIMSSLASEGMAIIMVSSELPEIMGMCDRVLIYHEGKLNGEVLRSQILSGDETQETILAKAFGQKEKGGIVA